MALVVSRKHLKAEACVRFEDISSRICGRKKWHNSKFFSQSFGTTLSGLFRTRSIFIFI